MSLVAVPAAVIMRVLVDGTSPAPGAPVLHLRGARVIGALNFSTHRSEFPWCSRTAPSTSP